MAERPRIAIVVQRFGEGITGGAELHAQRLVEVLHPHYAIDVLTSCARSHRTWQPQWEPGITEHATHRLLRFDHPPRDRSRSRRHMPLGAKWRRLWRDTLGRGQWPQAAMPTGRARADGLVYLRAQGPACDGLLAHLQAQAHAYRAVLCLTALFFPTALGVLVAPQRSLLIPTLHDDHAMLLPHFQRVFRQPKAVLYNSPAEQALAERLYGPGLAPAVPCGLGVDAPRPSSDPATLQAAQALTGGAPYLLYAGRVEVSKGCDQLVADFVHWRARQPQSQPLRLLLCGGVDMPLPAHPDVVCAGHVPRELLEHLMQGAWAVAMPSARESLSLTTLEAMAAGRLVLVNGDSEVLRDHVQRSGSGLAYQGRAGFMRGLDGLLAMSEAEREIQGQRARTYVAARYSWPHIIRTLRHAIDSP